MILLVSIRNFLRDHCVFLMLRVDRRPHLLFFRLSGERLLEWTGEVGSGVQRDGLFAAASMAMLRLIKPIQAPSSTVLWPCPRWLVHITSCQG